MFQKSFLYIFLFSMFAMPSLSIAQNSQTNTRAFFKAYQSLVEKSQDTTLDELGRETAVLAALYNVDIASLSTKLRQIPAYESLYEDMQAGTISRDQKFGETVWRLQHYRKVGGAYGFNLPQAVLLFGVIYAPVMIVGGVVVAVGVVVVHEVVQSARANQVSCVNGAYYISRKNGDYWSDIDLLRVRMTS